MKVIEITVRAQKVVVTVVQCLCSRGFRFHCFTKGGCSFTQFGPFDVDFGVDIDDGLEWSIVVLIEGFHTFDLKE